MADGSEVELVRANRVVAVKDENLGKLYKIKYRNGVPSYNAFPNCPEHCKVVNEALDTIDLKQLKKELDYMYYIERAVNMLDIDWVDAFGNRINKFKYE